MRARSHPSGSSWMCRQGWGHDSSEVYSDFRYFFFFFHTKGAEKILLGVSLCPRRVHSVFTVCCCWGFLPSDFLKEAQRGLGTEANVIASESIVSFQKKWITSYNPALLFSFRRTHIVRWLFFILDCSGDDSHSHLLINKLWENPRNLISCYYPTVSSLPQKCSFIASCSVGPSTYLEVDEHKAAKDLDVNECNANKLMRKSSF